MAETGDAHQHADDALNELSLQVDRLRNLHALFQFTVEHMDDSAGWKGGQEHRAINGILDALGDRISEADRLCDEVHNATRKMREKAGEAA